MENKRLFQKEKEKIKNNSLFEITYCEQHLFPRASEEWLMALQEICRIHFSDFHQAVQKARRSTAALLKLV